MKISKLFHWLYTFLMFLPILMVFTNFLMLVLHSVRFELPIDSMSTIVSAYNNVFNNDLFSWTQEMFLIEPFNYITELFGFSDNSLSFIFSYWLTISIVWLTFDLIMYLPNLAHKWLDKGAID